jgi:hypothetical protein
MLSNFSKLLQEPPAENPAWIKGGMLPKQGILLLGGPAKTRKSFLSLDIAHCLATGANVWGVEGLQVPVKARTLYVEAEIGEMELYRRVKMRYDTLQMPPPEDIFYVSKEKNMLVDTGSGIKNLARYIDQAEANVVILDPISRMMLGEENDSNDVGNLFRNIDDLLIDYKGLSVVIIHHHKKPSNDENFDALSAYNFRGSSRFFDAPDSIISLQATQARPGEWARLKTGWQLRQSAPPEEDIELAVLPGGIVIPAPRSAATVGGKGGGSMRAAKAAKGTWGP